MYRPYKGFGADAECHMITPSSPLKPTPIDKRDYDLDKAIKATRPRPPSFMFCEDPYEPETAPRLSKKAPSQNETEYNRTEKPFGSDAKTRKFTPY